MTVKQFKLIKKEELLHYKIEYYVHGIFSQEIMKNNAVFK